MIKQKTAATVGFASTSSINLAAEHYSLVSAQCCWAEAHVKIARMTLTIKLDGNWSSFQLANSAPPLSVTDSDSNPPFNRTSIVTRVGCAATGLVLCQRNT